MDITIEKLKKLRQSVQNLETALHEVWSGIDDIREDQQFSDLLQKAKQYKKKNQPFHKDIEELTVRIDEFENTMGEIPEDGTIVIDFEDAVSELIEWIKK
ncbi:uncharacterized coiled-coil DUF342 family protein [Neobacillus niacini]|jgi:uncharacterized coiled-coil DUF342 family protein|uniref:hypothetical protein n=1 Tax=Neobacillus driksii TaxID=3035913 RepID=UPI00277E95B6|nr:hypothetical protein [Neobacillus niacini]MDQ0970243.1 uncharacterized coiled-coil DUF342 family protein [Neobacillus niacini]